MSAGGFSVWRPGQGYTNPWSSPWPEGYCPPRMSEIVGFHWTCLQCGASVDGIGLPIHRDWHMRTAPSGGDETVESESTP